MTSSHREAPAGSVTGPLDPVERGRLALLAHLGPRPSCGEHTISVLAAADAGPGHTRLEFEFVDEYDRYAQYDNAVTWRGYAVVACEAEGCRVVAGEMRVVHLGEAAHGSYGATRALGPSPTT